MKRKGKLSWMIDRTHTHTHTHRPTCHVMSTYISTSSPHRQQLKGPFMCVYRVYLSSSFLPSLSFFVFPSLQSVNRYRPLRISLPLSLPSFVSLIMLVSRRYLVKPRFKRQDIRCVRGPLMCVRPFLVLLKNDTRSDRAWSHRQ